MSTSLREFLKQRNDFVVAEKQKNKLILDEWRAAVDQLLNQLQTWLADADPYGIIERELNQKVITEDGLGRYEIRRLELRAFGRWVGVIPKARQAIKMASPRQINAPDEATGRVDITDELRRYVLYRFSSVKGDEWYIHDVAVGSEMKVLTAELFESALMSYFQ